MGYGKHPTPATSGLPVSPTDEESRSTCESHSPGKQAHIKNKT